ncbi:HSP20 family molecular chaperone IbpA [Bradyrhizobium sp. JR18.2]
MIGRLFDALDEVQRTAEEAYPPYNIERLDENRFQISVALAGFTPEEVALMSEQNVLTLEGRKSEKEGKNFLHRGISARTSSGSSRSPITSRSRAPASRTACSSSTCSERFPKR